MKGILIHHQSTVHESVKYPCRQCNHQTILNGHLVQHRKALHEGVKYLCRQCYHQATTKEILFNYKVEHIKVQSSHAGIVTIKQGKSYFKLLG